LVDEDLSRKENRYLPGGCWVDEVKGPASIRCSLDERQSRLINPREVYSPRPIVSIQNEPSLAGHVHKRARPLASD
jgi:hypothetical protein